MELPAVGHHHIVEMHQKDEINSTNGDHTVRHMLSSKPESIKDLNLALEKSRAQRRWVMITRSANRSGISAWHGDAGLPRDRDVWAGRYDQRLARDDGCSGDRSVNAGRQPVSLSRCLRGDGSRECGRGDRLHPRADRTHYLGRRIFEDLTRKAERGEFPLRPMLMALLKAASVSGPKAG